MKTRKRRPKKKRGPPENQTVFCTECGVQLQNFCFSARADDIEAIRKTLAQCKKTGRFTGEFCAKLFIAEPVDIRTLLDNAQDESRPA